MRGWQGIHRDTVATDDAPYYLQNARLTITGEIQRRVGMSRLATQGAVVMTNYWTPTGYWNICVTSTGTIEAVAL